MVVATESAEQSRLEDELERLKNELAERLLRHASASSVGEIEARIQRTWAAIDACPEEE